MGKFKKLIQKTGEAVKTAKVRKRKKQAEAKAKAQGNPMRDMVNESVSEKAADKARRKENIRTVAKVGAGTLAVGATAKGVHDLMKAVGGSEVGRRLAEVDEKGKPLKKANGGMLDSPAAVKRRSGAAVKGFKKGGMATKWESKWG